MLLLVLLFMNTEGMAVRGKSLGLPCAGRTCLSTSQAHVGGLGMLRK